LAHDEARKTRATRYDRAALEAVRFTLVNGDKFVKTLELEDVQMEEVQRAISEFKGQADAWVEVDDGAWIRLEAVVAMEPVSRGGKPMVASV
jgi:hypothetical protein